jgi:hypothetical protein
MGRMAAASGIGPGWKQLMDELSAELRSLDANAEFVGPHVDHHGLMRLRASLAPEARVAGLRLLREYERRALSTCELCGDNGRVYGGLILVVRCPNCRAP